MEANSLAESAVFCQKRRAVEVLPTRSTALTTPRLERNMADLSVLLQDESVQARFWARVDRRGDDECWPWTGYRGTKGYGKFSVGRFRSSSSRCALAITTGASPAGLFALHSCDNPPCCNPKHLRWGTAKENAADTVERDRTHKWNGTRAGSRNPAAKLTPEQARAVYHSRNTRAEIAAAFGITKQTVTLVRRGKVYAEEIQNG